MDAAVIDRIRGYADDGMAPARIASTLGITEADVRLHLVGIPLQKSQRAALRSAAESAPTAPSGRKPTPTQVEAWRLCHDEGIYWADAARMMGTTTWTVTTAIRGYMAVMGIEGEPPGRMPKGEAQRRATEARQASPSSPPAPKRSDSGTVSAATAGTEQEDPERDDPAPAPSAASDQQVELQVATPEPTEPAPALVPVTHEEHRRGGYWSHDCTACQAGMTAGEAEMPSGRALLTMLARLDREIVRTDEARIELEAKVGRLRIAREVLAGLA